MPDDPKETLDKNAQAVAEQWAESRKIAPTAEHFDAEASIRVSNPGDSGSMAITDALDKLPRLTERREDGKFADIRDLGTIGEGGMAEIRGAIQVPIGREIATKRVKPDDDLGTNDRRSQLHGLLREAWVTGYLEHPNIVPIYRVGVDAHGDPIILMKQIEGVSWLELMGDPATHPTDETNPDRDSSALRDSLRESGVLTVDIDDTDPLRWHVETLIRVCHAIEFAHSRGILHRDIKPENVMLGSFGEVYVVDWGIAASYRPIDGNDRIPSLSDSNPSVGTPAFMAPEMIEGRSERIGPHSDVYLLGGTLYNILTGRAPHRGESILDILTNIRSSDGPDFPDQTPARLADICRRAMAPNIEDRYENVRALREDLQDYVRHHESVSLSNESAQRLEELESLISRKFDQDTERESREAAHDNRIRELFAECRFGFEQALELSETNEEARRGLQRSLELMIRRELRRGGYEAAVSYLADLPEPRPELRERVEQLGDQLDARDQEYEQLQEFRHQRDVEVGRNARSLFVLAMGGLTAMLNIVPAAWPSLTGHPPGRLVTLGTFLIYFTGVGALTYRARHALIKNAANGKMIISLFVILIADGLFRVVEAGFGLPRAAMAPLKAIMVGLAFNVLAIALDLRLLWVGLTFLGVAGVQTMFPDHVLGIAAGGVTLGTLLLAGAWWRGSDDSDSQD